jgi:hypothetical protein
MVNGYYLSSVYYDVQRNKIATSTRAVFEIDEVECRNLIC